MAGMVYVKKRKQTTQIGYINRNNQEVMRRTNSPGTDHNQVVYVLHCEYCGKEYGANGSDIHHKLCPNTSCPSEQKGKPGIPYV
jgi:hypothetical protein